MQVIFDVLLLLDLDGPETFGAFFILGRRGMIMARMRVGFGDAQCEKGERKEFEDFGYRG